MLKLDTELKLGNKVLVYLLLKTTLVFALISIIVSIATTTVQTNFPRVPFIFLFFLVFGYVQTYLWWAIFSYTVSKDNVTVHSGIIFQQTKSVNFNDLESVNSASGPVLLAFGLRKIKGFTSSPEQIFITSSSNGQTQTSHRPDVEIFLDKDSAMEFLQLAKQGDVQSVRSVS